MPLCLRTSLDLTSRLPFPLGGGGATYYYGYARAALVDGLHLMGGSSGDNVIVPEYICEELTDYLSPAGFELRYYRLHPDLSADTADVVALADARTIAVLMVHYFGFPQPLVPLREICQRLGVWLIEDNAHGFLSGHGAQPLGRTGDIAVFCMRKTLDIPNGAALLINSPELRSRSLAEPPVPSTYDVVRHLFRAKIMSRLDQRIPRLAALLRSTKRSIAKPLVMMARELSVGQGSRSARQRYPEYPDGMRTILPQSWYELKRIDYTEIIRRRRQNYVRIQQWLEGVPDCDLPWPSLAPGVSPQVFPLIVADGQQVIQELQAHGIAASFWPTLPQEIEARPTHFRVANHWRRHLVTLPVHQAVSVQDLVSIPPPGGTAVQRLLAAYGVSCSLSGR